MSSTQADPISLSRNEVARLTAQIAGPVLLPDRTDHAAYEAECATFNLLTPVRPAVAIGATGTADVQAAVRFAAERDLPISVLTTGHQVARSAEGSVLINMSRMNAKHVDDRRRLASVGGGVRWQQLLSLTDKHDVAAASGTSATVGVVGYHLGGGASPILGRTHGYAADHVQAAEIVTADGVLRHVTAATEQELFWALRGGKGNFGVVTSLEFTVFPLKWFYGGGLVFDGRHAAGVLHTWRHWVVELPSEMSSSIAFLRLPALPTVPEPVRGRFVVHVRFSSLRARDDADRVLAPMRGIRPRALSDTITELVYRDAGSIFTDPPSPLPWVERSHALRSLPREAADTLLTMLGPDADTQLGFVELRHLGGALTHRPEVPNAVAGRNAPFSLFGSGAGRPELAHAFQEQLTALSDAMMPWVQAEMMPNLLGGQQGATPEDLRAIYGPDRYDRLVAIKKRFDPGNLFRMNHNIRPTTATSSQE